MSNGQLGEAGRNGDSTLGIRALLAEHEASLLRYALRLTGDAHQARDCVQETFLRLCRADAATLRGHEAAWLYRVCRQRAIDWKRKVNRMQAVDVHDAACLTREPAPADRLERQEDTSAVLALLSALPENQQDVLRLKFQAGLSYREISEAMDLSVSNVGFLIHTGLKKIRERLQIERTP
jgi:RNA polymerase sigma factor (sigma-70 family)